jgi:hypothetical protein
MGIALNPNVMVALTQYYVTIFLQFENKIIDIYNITYFADCSFPLINNANYVFRLF